MSTILFLLAILLAIPTSGLSLLVFFTGYMAWALFRAKVRMHYADTQKAYLDVQNHITSPSLEKFGEWRPSADDAAVFWHGVVKLAARYGVPEVYTMMTAKQPEFASLIREFVNSMHRSGSSFSEKQIATSEFIKKAWDRMDYDQKKLIHDAVRNGVTVEDVVNLNL